jgi:hypothetical protein
MQEAFRMIQIARALGLKVMLGCMIEARWASPQPRNCRRCGLRDLDGNLLISNDPYTGLRVSAVDSAAGRAGIGRRAEARVKGG